MRTGKTQLGRWLCGALVAGVAWTARADLWWAGHVTHCPQQGFIETTDDLWINIESAPAGAATGAHVVYSLDGGSTWTSAAMSANGRLGAHDWWHANLGSFPGGTTIRYAVEVFSGGGSVWDNNGGADYAAKVNGGAAFRWFGNTRHDPPNQQLDPGENVTVFIETYPIGTAASARVVYSSDGFHWNSVAMEKNGTAGANDLWQTSIGSFEEGSTNLYAVEITFGPGDVEWDTNNGANYPVIVNKPHPGQWVGHTRHSPLNGNIDPGTTFHVLTESSPQTKAVSARVAYSVNGGGWLEANLLWHDATASNDVWRGELGPFAAGDQVHYAVAVHFGFGGETWDNAGGTNFYAYVNSATTSRWVGNTHAFPAQGDLDPEDDLWINTESRPAAEALSARVVWSTNNGLAWTETPLAAHATNGNKTLWHANLGAFPAGTTNRFAVEVTFAGGEILWDNAGGADYRVVVNTPLHLQAIRDTYHYPPDAEFDAGDEFWINTETQPAGAATNVRVLFTTDGGANWQEADLASNGVANGRTRWHANLGAFAEGTVIRYALEARDAYGASLWDNNWNEDFHVRVLSLIRDLYPDKARYHPGDTAVLSAELFNASGSPVSGTLRLRVSHLFGGLAVIETNVTVNAGQGLTVDVPWATRYDDFRGYAVDADFLAGGATNDRRSTALDVSSDWTKFPRYGFFSDFHAGEQAWDSEAKAKELSKYHINAIQFYDWMWEHDRLIPYSCDGQMLDLFEGLLGGEKSLATVSNKIAAAKGRNMFTMAYDLLYGDSGFGSLPLHPAWAAYNKPWTTAPVDIHQHPLIGFNPPRAIWIMDASNEDWQRWIFNQYKDAMLKLGFEGIHLDNLGGSWNYRYNSNEGIPEWIAFPSFIQDCRGEVRTVNPDARVVHNDVAGNYLDAIAPSATDVYYHEVWIHDRYADVRDLILRAKERGNKQVVLAAYMNYGDYTNYLSEASVRLMDACVFANGAFHIEMGEGVEMLSNHYFPMHWPPMRPTLKRAMRDYYDFIVKYENLLFFNTLGNVVDGTDGANLSSPSHALSKHGAAGAIWTVAKLWRDEFDTLNLVNLHGVDEYWRNRSARPPPQTDIALKYYVDKKVQRIHVATPDDGLGRPAELPFTEGVDGGGAYVAFVVPRLEYWNLVVLDKRTDVKVDGWPGDWEGVPPSGIHEITVDRGEWIYRGDTNDFRTFAGASQDEDITEVRFTCDETYLYGLVRMQNIADAALPAIGIAWNAHLQGGTFPWIGDASTPSGSIGLEHADQHATRQIMLYTAGGSAKVRLYNGDVWYAPNALDAAVSVSPDDNCIEFRINRSDLDLFYPQKVTVSLASFRGSGNEAGDDATYDSPDHNNDAIDVMGGEPGVSENAWGRDLSDDTIGRHYQVLFNQQGADASIRIAWPNFDGQRIDVLDDEAYTVVAQFTEALPAVTSDFTFKVDGVAQDAAGYFFQDEAPGDLQNEIRFPWMDTGSGIRTIEVVYAGSGFHLAALRVVDLNPDADGDGIRDALEDVNRNGIHDAPFETSHTSADTDADGLADGFEDGDRDGRIAGDLNNNYLHDAGELWSETDPRNWDTDGDGLPDGWEVAHGLNLWADGVIGHTNYHTGAIILTTDHGAHGDPDGDGMTNAQEWFAGTSPQDAASFLRLGPVQLSPDGDRSISWTCVSGRLYRLYGAVSTDAPYAPLTDALPADDGVATYEDTNATPALYFQLRVVTP